MTERQPVVVDVREELRAGKEPFQKIMAAADTVPVGGHLILYATFKPVPLIAVLKSQGFEGEPTRLDDGDWRVDFQRTAPAPEGPGFPSVPESREATPGDDGDAKDAVPADIQLDHRGLEPPEPMVRTLEAILQLKPGQRIVGQFDRTPMFLLPKLEEMGYAYDVETHDDGTATVTIRHGE